MSEKLTDEQLLNKVRKRLDAFQREFVEHLEPVEQTTRSRLLRLFAVWKQTNLRRVVDLAAAAHEMFRQARLVPACTLTRSVFETVGIQYYIYKKLIEHTDKSDAESIHKLLMSSVFGRKDKSRSRAPIQVLTAIDHMDKVFRGSRAEYEHLCEYAHPNLKGGFGTYVRQEGQKLESHFGTNPQRLEMGIWGLESLDMILIFGAEINNHLCAFQPAFVAMAEKACAESSAIVTLA